MHEMRTRAHFETRPGDGCHHSGRWGAIVRAPPRGHRHHQRQQAHSRCRPRQSQTHYRHRRFLRLYLAPELCRRILGPLEATAAEFHLELALHFLRPAGVYACKNGGHFKKVRKYSLFILVTCNQYQYTLSSPRSFGVFGCLRVNLNKKFNSFSSYKMLKCYLCSTGHLLPLGFLLFGCLLI